MEGPQETVQLMRCFLWSFFDGGKGMGKRRAFTFVVNDTGCFVCNSHCKSRDGHLQFKLNKKVVPVHRYIYEECFGPIPEGQIIRHKCDNPACINPEHLMTGVHEDNVRDRVDRNRSAKGVHNGRSKLNPEKVKEIRKSDMTTVQLGRLYGVDRKVIYDIRKYKLWKDVI